MKKTSLALKMETKVRFDLVKAIHQLDADGVINMLIDVYEKSKNNKK